MPSYKMKHFADDYSLVYVAQAITGTYFPCISYNPSRSEVTAGLWISSKEEKNETLKPEEQSESNTDKTLARRTLNNSWHNEAIESNHEDMVEVAHNLLINIEYIENSESDIEKVVAKNSVSHIDKL
ncbi:unnamed protein product [Diatraea saccharalis]|uniref:Uncharacterized protein n=1 Tax=Diatraea saccharalis TaxID=40085 RepID=A0A9N9WFL9_9NEOP|nr:unnamed protein product [Diatraea saccharalis]